MITTVKFGEVYPPFSVSTPGRIAYILCGSITYPKWTHKNRNLQLFSSKYDWGYNPYRLIIKDVQLEDMGFYECHGSLPKKGGDNNFLLNGTEQFTAAAFIIGKEFIFHVLLITLHETCKQLCFVLHSNVWITLM